MGDEALVEEIARVCAFSRLTLVDDTSFHSLPVCAIAATEANAKTDAIIYFMFCLFFIYKDSAIIVVFKQKKQ